MPRLLVIDCKDSFVYNLVQLLREQELCAFDICSVDAVPLDRLHQYDALLLSPGPGVPSELPLLMQAIDLCEQTHAILGVCLGHQALALHYGAQLRQIPSPKHGHSSELHYTPDPIFEGLAPHPAIGRYHSWVIAPETLPTGLEVIGSCTEGGRTEIMAIRHKNRPIYGVQFHPESIITQDGWRYIHNLLRIALQRSQSSFPKCTSEIL